MDLREGQTVYLWATGRTSASKDESIVEAVLQKIGTRYLTVGIGKYCKYKFDKKTLREATRYSPDYYLYFDRQQIEDERESQQLMSEIHEIIKDNHHAHRNHLGYRKNLNLDQLRRIKAILTEN